MNIKNKIINLEWWDYHMHSLNFSDGLNTIDEIIRFAWEIWLNEIAITDHSQAALNYTQKKYWITPKTQRRHAKRYRNIINEINVIFWVETDLLNEDWDICFDILWTESDFNIVSLHKWIYKWDYKEVTQAYINAIKKHHKKINLIWHPCMLKTSKYLDMQELVKTANDYNIALEFDATNFVRWKTDLEKLDYLLINANKIYINSDAHNLAELRDSRKEAIKYLKENKYI